MNAKAAAAIGFLYAEPLLQRAERIACILIALLLLSGATAPLILNEIVGKQKL